MVVEGTVKDYIEEVDTEPDDSMQNG